MTANSDSVLAAFSVDHAARVTGLSKSRLTRWDKLGFFSPEYLDEDDRGNPYARVYSFSDLVGLRTLKILADKHKVPLVELRKAAVELERRSTRPWSEIPLAVLQKKVVFDLDLEPRNITDGQYVLRHIRLGRIEEQVRESTEQLRYRDPSMSGRISRNKFILRNAPVLDGTRIPVAVVADFIDAGFDDTAIVEEYPTLTIRVIEAVRQLRKDAA